MILNVQKLFQSILNVSHVLQHGPLVRIANTNSMTLKLLGIKNTDNFVIFLFWKPNFEANGNELQSDRNNNDILLSSIPRLNLILLEPGSRRRQCCRVDFIITRTQWRQISIEQITWKLGWGSRCRSGGEDPECNVNIAAGTCRPCNGENPN